MVLGWRAMADIPQTPLARAPGRVQGNGMWDKIKRRFNARRLLLLAALAGVALYVGWRTGGFDQAPAQKPCEAGRKEIKDDKGQVVQVTRTTCFEDKK
ncbi:hypothetical protein CA223_06285 [Sphingomonas koreensis]|jgi:hypothetical protein|uniref:Uncharacterized protein n=2 Tax=Sphingomonas koreensis TaxID=93064 RepID=A0A1L6JDE3_9SPHN|nr:hypothetical protein [Sphingomonas koreensis]APR53500.1 hypothetical protein BRX40_14640 [Sphingomonas koreensis]RSU19576.1 hypothetical protein CA225_23480 [Sphingomonas koreensis]RSU21045.1 hypothetical protein CA222_19945 [Sphingomonas koreensis]RSU37256.1 hypothetical protein BRX39_04965 [Sphingomonas koreensis]RSU42439.1 hypothetical protein CA223_06285 [Sphingomonas koreensis]